jgi:putative membrane protein
MSNEQPARPRPRAFRLDENGGARTDFVIEEKPDAYEAEAELQLSASELAVEDAQAKGFLVKGGFSWGGVLLSAIGGLVTFAGGLWFSNLIDQLFARSAALGAIGLGLAALALLAALVLAGREIRAILRQRRIAVLHRQLALAHETDDRDLARAKVGELVSLYKRAPRLEAARNELRDLCREIVDGRDLIEIAERKLMPGLDDAARKEIADAAKRVSVVSAISPRAIVDVIFVAAQALRLIRRIADIYGGRPGMLGAWRLARAVGAHLAITGGMAVGDSLLQQVLGHGIASKISARLGEGVLNGLLTARIGVSAMSVCRPMPFFTRKPPGLGEVAPFLIGGDKSKTGDPTRTG